MVKKLVLVLIFFCACTIPTNAHPLGNFSINNFSKIDLEEDKIKLRCILDMAEIPTFQESQRIDTDNDKKLSEEELSAYLENLTSQYIKNLKLAVDSQPLPIKIESKNITLPVGSGNLPVLRIEWDFAAEIPESSKNAVRALFFENTNFKERVGWNEIVVNRASGVKIFDSSAYGSAVTDELKTYPEDMLSSPLSEREAKFSFTTTGEIPANAKPLENRNGTVSSPVQTDGFTELISEKELTPLVVILGLFIAFGFGAMHALSPGHGKTVVGAYLVGSKGTPKHAAFLGLTVTITHTLGVFAIGIITLFASQFILPETIMPILSFVSGLLVLFIGLNLFKNRLLAALGYKSAHVHHHDHTHFHEDGSVDGFHHKHDGEPHHHGDGDLRHTHDHSAHAHDHSEHGHHHHHEHNHHHEHDHHHAHGHDHHGHAPGHHAHSHDDHDPHAAFVHTHDGHTHSHLPPENITWKSLLGLGISGGLLPCPSALVLMLAAINLNRIGYGLVLTVAFSIGLAATLMCVGLAFLYLGKFLDRPSLGNNRIIKALPVFSAFVITCLGGVICYNSLA